MKISEYPLGIQSFRKLREQGCIYVDKTAEIFNLVSGSNYYFLSRPRRFGKSLLVSTLEEFFSGNRELFKGLAIDSLLPEEWEKHPVLHFDLSRQRYTSAEDLPTILDEILCEYERIYGTERTQVSDAQRFGGLIDRAYEQTGKSVVVLVDEYDVPIINCLEDAALMEENRKLLRGFYGVMKSRDAKLRFVLLTGVGKLGKLSVFSGLNNIRDITLDRTFSTICGITEDELNRYFDEGVGELAATNGRTVDETYRDLKLMYDGYHFAKDLTDIYNPFSILYCLVSHHIRAYWFETGTPEHLIHVLKSSNESIEKFNGIRICEDALKTGENSPMLTMLQTGYLTIKSYDDRRAAYTLGYPNKEVERGVINNLIPLITHLEDSLTLRGLDSRTRTLDRWIIAE